MVGFETHGVEMILLLFIGVEPGRSDSARPVEGLRD